MALESMISGDPAVRRRLDDFELAQVWTRDPARADVARSHLKRMDGTFGVRAIPFHVVVAPDGVELARLTYDPRMGPRDYLAFLARGMAAFEARYPRPLPAKTSQDG